MRRPWDSSVWERQEAWSRRFGRYVTIEQLAALSGASLSILRRIAHMELLARTWVGGTPMYPIQRLSQVRRMLRLHYDLGVSWSSMGLVLRLLDRIEELERGVSGEWSSKDDSL